MFTDAEIISVLAGMIGRDEGCRLHSYPDTRGFWTIGWGHHDDTVKPGQTCTQAEADAWRDEAIEDRIRGLDATLPWWRGLDAVRAAVMVDVAYELGLRGFLNFKITIPLIEAHDFIGASHQLMKSQMAIQVPNRAWRLSKQLATGVTQ